MKQVPVVHCLSFILYFFFSHWIACTSIYCFGIFKRFLEIIAHFLTHASKTFIFVLSVHKLTIHCQLKTAEEITQIANMTPLKEIRICEAK
jgi:hypothetical protein